MGHGKAAAAIRRTAPDKRRRWAVLGFAAFCLLSPGAADEFLVVELVEVEKPASDRLPARRLREWQ